MMHKMLDAAALGLALLATAALGFGLALLAAAALALLAAQPAPAAEGWQGRPLICDPADLGPGTPELKQCQDWISGVLQPNSRSTCCGESDAFVADSFKFNDKGEYVAVITRDYPPLTGDDGEGSTVTIPGVPAGTEIVIPKERLNKSFDADDNNPLGTRSREGNNPTGRGIVFMNVNKTVYCYFAPTLVAIPGSQFAER